MIAAVPDHFCRHFNSVRAFRHRGKSSRSHSHTREIKCQVALHMGPKFVGHFSAMCGPFGTGAVEDSARRKGRCPATQFGVWEQREIEALLRCPAVSVLGSNSWEIRQRYRSRPSRKFHQSCRTGLPLCREHMHDIAAELLIDMKIYLGDRLLWRVFTYNLYLHKKKVFIYDQGTKPAALRWSQKAAFFLTRKKRHFLDTKKNRFFAQFYENRGQPKMHNKKT